GTFLNLGHLALSEQDFVGAESHLKKAAALRPRDANTLMLLAYAENGAHEYHHAVDTAARVHALPHKGMANVHYIAASAAIALKDFAVVQRELETFVREDPSNPMVPAARQNLEILVRNKSGAVEPTAAVGPRPANAILGPRETETFPNSERLRTQLAALGDDANGDLCSDCATTAEAITAAAPA